MFAPGGGEGGGTVSSQLLPNVSRCSLYDGFYYPDSFIVSVVLSIDGSIT